jgi:hypothetical protein
MGKIENKIKAALDAAMAAVDQCLHSREFRMGFPRAEECLHAAKNKLNRAYIKVNEGDDK